MATFGVLTRYAVFAILGAVLFSTASHANPLSWKFEWGKTDFSNHSVEFSEIMSGGPPKDGIPSIDDPKFVALADLKGLAATEPVIGFSHNGDARAYPLRILIWHEIVNDTVGGMPITVTYCPLCNSAIVFDRRLDGRVLDFGTTGKLRKSDLVMYDRQTESWWQQFIGEGIVGEMTGKRLKMLPARVESLPISVSALKPPKSWSQTVPPCGPMAEIPMPAMIRWPGRFCIVADIRKASNPWPMWSPSENRFGRSN